MSGSSLQQDELDAAIKAATDAGFEVIRADATTLLLDLDTAPALEQFARVLPLVKEKYWVTKVEKWSSKSGNTHVRISLQDEVAWPVRYALQAALGSDGVREVLACIQMQNGCQEASLLFKPT